VRKACEAVEPQVPPPACRCNGSRRADRGTGTTRPFLACRALPWGDRKSLAVPAESRFRNAHDSAFDEARELTHQLVRARPADAELLGDVARGQVLHRLPPNFSDALTSVSSTHSGSETTVSSSPGSVGRPSSRSRPPSTRGASSDHSRLFSAR